MPQFTHRVSLDCTRSASYAFLVHARTFDDMRAGYPHCRHWNDTQIAQAMDASGPLIISTVTACDGSTGIVVGAMFPPSALRGGFGLVRQKIRAAARFVRDLGIRHLGLGALTAGLSRYGRDLDFSPDFLPTTGHALTPWALEQMVNTVTAHHNGSPLTVAIVGAAGSVGVLSATRLSRRGYPVLLIDVPARAAKLQTLCNRLVNAHYSTSLADVRQVRIIITVTNATTQLLDPWAMPPGMVLIDDSQPWCWDHHEALRRFRLRGDLLPLDGGLLTAPQGTTTAPPFSEHTRPEDVFSCLAEVKLLSSGRGGLRPSIGRNHVENVSEQLLLSDAYGQAALEAGFSMAPLQCAGHCYADGQVSAFFGK